MNNKMREKFEMWCRANGKDDHEMQRCAPYATTITGNDYSWNDIDGQWKAWQAGIASQTCVAKPELPVKTWQERLTEDELNDPDARTARIMAMQAEIRDLRAALSVSGQTAQAAMPSPFEDSTRIEDLIHANQNMHLAMQEQSELVCSLTRELNETKLKASFAALPVGKRVLVDSAPQPSQVSEQDKLDAERWRFTMAFQSHPSVERPEAMTAMWRKVIDEGRLKPTREEYEAATDAAIAASRQPKPE